MPSAAAKVMSILALIAMMISCADTPKAVDVPASVQQRIKLAAEKGMDSAQALKLVGVAPTMETRYRDPFAAKLVEPEVLEPFPAFGSVPHAIYWRIEEHPSMFSGLAYGDEQGPRFFSVRILRR